VLARLGNLLLIIALLGATGAHWAVLQSVAWASMLASNARTESLPTALENTFDGKHPCNLCKQIARGHQSEPKQDVRTEARTLEFVNAPAVFFIAAPAEFELLPAVQLAAALMPHSPPVPPPRALAA
jgi:hypothetical protein